ncbi:hypothetical protein PLESTB_000066000 [Pleodorina starrii]|uniref:Protein kinase domain-containing protein n=1 Tax=Pleodorina starrii TaxID=330485 RepID=A0A9W6EWY3_9CHLO|nr:hypothetical protein PLESTB_000066000 [Pleodorina starrii]GLC67410.1 hypothetical protein PLESTF_000553100 [Pleodorina starrii]
MDVRRLNSSPLTDTGGNCVPVASTPHNGSPRAQGARLPALWKTLKSKLGGLSGSKSVNNLVSLATEASASPGTSPLTHAAAPCLDRPAHAQCSTSRSIFLPGTSPEGALCRKETASLVVLGQQFAPKVFGRNSSPTDVCTSTNALLYGAGSSSGSAASNVTAKPISAEPALPSPFPEPVAAPSLGSSYHLQIQGLTVIPEAAPSPNRKLLAISPALPSSMRRSVWALEDYVIQRRLFKGTSSAVYRATCRRSGMPVALKVYFLSRVPANVVHMLKREIEIHCQLVHRHIARLHAAFMDEGDRVVLVQEYAAQGDLYGVLQRLGGRMPPEQVADGVMRPFLEALSYMHSKGVCHRDIKPENILFSKSWRLLIADFGVSINLNHERAVTRAGTEGYMAPEVERCPLKVEPHENKDDPRYAYSTAVDIWAVGVLAYELMVGFPPVVAMAPSAAPAPASAYDAASDSLSGFVRSHMTAASLHFPGSVPPLARAFVLAALSPDPLERPTAAQLLQHPWLQRQPAPAPAVAAAPPAAPNAAVASPCAVVAETLGRVSGSPPAGLRCWDGDGSAPKPAAVGASAPSGQWVQCGSGGRPSCSALCTPA